MGSQREGVRPPRTSGLGSREGNSWRRLRERLGIKWADRRTRNFPHRRFVGEGRFGYGLLQPREGSSSARLQTPSLYVYPSSIPGSKDGGKGGAVGNGGTFTTSPRNFRSWPHSDFSNLKTRPEISLTLEHSGRYADDSGPACYFCAHARKCARRAKTRARGPRALYSPATRTGARGRVCRRETPRPAKSRNPPTPVHGPSRGTRFLTGNRIGDAAGRDQHAFPDSLATMCASCDTPGP